LGRTLRVRRGVLDWGETVGVTEDPPTMVQATYHCWGAPDRGPRSEVTVTPTPPDRTPGAPYPWRDREMNSNKRHTGGDNRHRRRAALGTLINLGVLVLVTHLAAHAGVVVLLPGPQARGNRERQHM